MLLAYLFGLVVTLGILAATDKEDRPTALVALAWPVLLVCAILGLAVVAGIFLVAAAAELVVKVRQWRKP